MTDWNATQYLKFADERNRPVRDLLAQIPNQDVGFAFDLGCGPGNSTELLAAAVPQAKITGLDSSPAMLEKARKTLPHIQFIEADLVHWQAPPEVDLLFSNATFQWVPNHLAVLKRLLAGLKPGGTLAVQVPDNLAEPSHAAMREASLDKQFASKLTEAAAAREPILKPVDYYAALKPFCTQFDVWHTHYNHPLNGLQGIVDWLMSAGLRPFLNPLTSNEQQDYLALYKEKLAPHYPVQADGKALLKFPRLFMVAVR